MKAALHGQLSNMQEYFDRSTRTLDEADSGFAPNPDLFTAAQMVAHVAQTVDWFMTGAFAPGGFNLDFETLDKQVRACNSIGAAREWFQRACKSAHTEIDKHSDEEWVATLPPGPVMGGAPRHAIFGAMIDHTAHHRGALTVYARLKGKVPPMPYMEM